MTAIERSLEVFLARSCAAPTGPGASRPIHRVDSELASEIDEDCGGGSWDCAVPRDVGDHIGNEVVAATARSSVCSAPLRIWERAAGPLSSQIAGHRSRVVMLASMQGRDCRWTRQGSSTTDRREQEQQPSPRKLRDRQARPHRRIEAVSDRRQHTSRRSRSLLKLKGDSRTAWTPIGNVWSNSGAARRSRRKNRREFSPPSYERFARAIISSNLVSPASLACGGSATSWVLTYICCTSSRRFLSAASPALGSAVASVGRLRHCS